MVRYSWKLPQLATALVVLTQVTTVISAPLSALQEEESILEKLFNKNKNQNSARESKPKAYATQTFLETISGNFEGDLLITPEQADLIEQQIGKNVPTSAINEDRSNRPGGRFKRKAVRNTTSHWPQALVPYVFSESITADGKANIKKAMDHWEEHTCIRFVPYTVGMAHAIGHEDFVEYFNGSGCYSNVGRIGNGKQIISVGLNCDNALGTTVHEIGHTLGFFHEQSRPDRDHYIKLSMENVIPRKEFNFAKYNRGDISDENVPYDLGSVMHYGQDEFATNESMAEGLVTLETKDKEMQNVIGQRLGLSFYDTKMANEMYRCNEKCSNSHIQCENGGYIGPDCNCKCPEGLTGPYCSDVTKTTVPCGGIYETCQGTIQTPNYPDNYFVNTACYWLIKAPHGSSIEVSFKHFDIEDDFIHGRHQCGWDWVEVRKFGPDRAGPRFCGHQLNGSTTTYNVSSLLIKFKSDDSKTLKGFQATYRIIQKKTGSWGPFTDWTRCPVSCGGGIQIRMRSCLPSGTVCPGKDLEFKKCNEHLCHEEM